MNLQLIKDGSGNDTWVFVPISDWEAITQKHADLKALLPAEPVVPTRKKLSELAGSLPKETAEAMLKYLEESRNEWEEKLEKRF